MENMTREKMMEALEKAKHVNVRVDEYKVGDARASYFNFEHNIYDEFGDNIDDLEFFEDKVSMVRNNNSYNTTEALDVMFSVLPKFMEDITAVAEILDQEASQSENEDFKSIADMTLEEIEQKYPDAYSEIIDYLDELTEDDLDIWNDGSTIFDCDYIDEVINNATYEALAYWTVYFNPKWVEDEDIAVQCGLTPFKYKDTFYLAFGGCGMDLSPKLDAYIALTLGEIPNDSGFLKSDKSYFEYVAGKETTEMVEKKCKREKKRVKIEFDLED